MAVNLATGYNRTTPEPIDVIYLASGLVPYASVSAANTAIVSGVRYIGQFVNIANDLYWYKNGITNADLVPFTAGGGAGSVNIISVTYSALQTLIGTSGLSQGSYYLITDYQTIYDQPSYSAPNVASTPTTLTATAEPIIVQAATTSTLNSRAISTVYPSHVIEYDINFTATEVNATPAKGRITLRIDDRNNKTNYDSVGVVFKRYESAPSSGIYSIYWNNGNASSDFNTFEDNCYNISIGDFYTALDTSPISPFILSNNVFFVQSYDTQTGNNFYNNTFLGTCAGNVFGDTFSSNLFNGYVGSCRIGNTFTDNTLGDVFQNNIIGSGFNNNIIGDYCTLNQIGNGFSNNTVGTYFSGNVLGNSFDSNTIGINFENNQIRNSFATNVIGNSFSSNIIANSCNTNSIGDNFTSNLIGDSFYNNTVANGFQSNNVDDQCQNNGFGLATSLNQLGYGFLGNTIALGFQNNIIGKSFQFNILGTYFQFNNIFDGFQSNTILTYCIGNSIGNNCVTNSLGNYFKSNKIGNDFQYNQISDNFGWNIGGTARNGGNKIGDGFQFNFIGNNVCSNTFMDDVVGNIFNVEVTISYTNLIGTFTAGQIITNTVDTAKIISDNGSNAMKVCNFSGIFSVGQTIDNSPSSGSASATITAISVTTVNDAFFNYNEIETQFTGNLFGNSFLSSKIGKGFKFNTIGDNAGFNHLGELCTNNIIGTYFQSNTIQNSFNSNTIGTDFQSNNIQNDFSANIIGNYCQLNNFGNLISANSIADFFKNNNICSSFVGNINIQNDFQWNTFEFPTTSQDYSTATYVYQPYTCVIFCNNATNVFLYFYDSTNAMVVANPTL